MRKKQPACDRPQEKPLQGTEPENIAETKKRGQHVKTQVMKKTILGRSSKRKKIIKFGSFPVFDSGKTKSYFEKLKKQYLHFFLRQT